MKTYYGILDGSGSIWGVRVPDLPGVNGGGATPDEAIADAISAAADWSEYQRAKGYPIADPRTADEIHLLAEDGERLVEISFEVPPSC